MATSWRSRGQKARGESGGNRGKQGTDGTFSDVLLASFPLAPRTESYDTRTADCLASPPGRGASCGPAPIQAYRTVSKTKPAQKEIMLSSRTEFSQGASSPCSLSKLLFCPVNSFTATTSCCGCFYFGVARRDLFTPARPAQRGASSPGALSALSSPAQSLGARRRRRLLRFRARPAHPAQSRFHP